MHATEISVESVAFCQRVLKEFRLCNIKTLGDVASRSRFDLLRLPLVGQRALENIELQLAKHGLYLSDRRQGILIDAHGVMRIGYDSHNGLVFPEAVVEENLRKIIAAGRFFSVGSTLEVTYIRLMVKRGELSNVRFVVNDQEIMVDVDGNLKSSPPGFADTLDKWLMELF